MSEYTERHSLLQMGLRSCRAGRVPILTPAETVKSTNNGHVSIRTGPWSKGRRWSRLMNQCFLSHYVDGHQRQCDGLDNNLLGSWVLYA